MSNTILAPGSLLAHFEDCRYLLDCLPEAHVLVILPEDNEQVRRTLLQIAECFKREGQAVIVISTDQLFPWSWTSQNRQFLALN